MTGTSSQNRWTSSRQVRAAAGALAGTLLLASTSCGGGDGDDGAGVQMPDTPEVAELWCTRFERFAASAMLVDVDATAADAPARLAALREGGGPAADDVFAAAEDAEILLGETPPPAPLIDALRTLVASGAGAGVGDRPSGGELDEGALAAVAAHVRTTCGGDPEAVALLARLGG